MDTTIHESTVELKPTDTPTASPNCRNRNFRVSAKPLGYPQYTGTIHCDNLSRFKDINICSKRVELNGSKLIRNLCPGKCRKECMDTTIHESTVELKPTDTPTASPNCRNRNFRVSAKPLGYPQYTGTIHCDNLSRFKDINICSKRVELNGSKLIRNLCPGKCKKACTDTPTVSPINAPTALSCDNNMDFRIRAKSLGFDGFVTCNNLYRFTNIDVCSQEVNFNGPKWIRDLCPGKCKSACCVDFEKLSLNLKNSKKIISCNQKKIERFCNEEVSMFGDIQNTQVRDWCPNACGSTCVTMPNPQARGRSEALSMSDALSTSNSQSHAESDSIQRKGALTVSDAPSMLNR